METIKWPCSSEPIERKIPVENPPLHLIEIPVEELRGDLEVAAVIHSDSQITGIQMRKIKNFYLCLHPKLFAEVM